ncbi:MAG: DUF4332 domain-containing protein [Clostridiales bacterium]|nr:DUF4332 domain-containing protein [Clostridiales bacterium]
MTYDIIQIEGIGESYATKLNEVGIDTTDQLLDQTETPRLRATLAEKTGISPKLILRWANHADLFRINGVAGQFAELLEAAGVDTIKELRHRVAINLVDKMKEVNYQRNLCNRVPSVAEVQRMIDQAKELEPRLKY